MKKLCVIDIQDKSWRVNSHLGSIIDFQLPSGMRRSRVGILSGGRLLALDSPGALKRDALPGCAWDIYAEPLLPALAALAASPYVSRAGLAGDHLRAITPADAKEADLVESIRRDGLDIRSVEKAEPTLEDVFLSLTSSKSPSA